MIKVFNKKNSEWLSDVYVDEFENVYQYKKTTRNNIIVTPVDDECFVLQDIGYKDRNQNQLYEYDIIATEQVKQGVIICYECTYIVMDYLENKYHFLQELNPLEVKRIGSVIDTELIDKDGNIVVFEFKKQDEVNEYE